MKLLGANYHLLLGFQWAADFEGPQSLVWEKRSDLPFSHIRMARIPQGNIAYARLVNLAYASFVPW